jgi:DNA-binding Xre family transcriptional regulator
MKPSPKKKIRRRVVRLSPAKIRAFKKLAQRIDAEEQEEIKEFARGVFARHTIARDLVRKLKAKRLENGMSLTELANRTGIAKSNLSRLENREGISPTLETLHCYALALGMQMRIELN